MPLADRAGGWRSRQLAATAIPPYPAVQKTPAANAETPQFLKTFIAHGRKTSKK
jgi:hypothetical protein